MSSNVGSAAIIIQIMVERIRESELLGFKTRMEFNITWCSGNYI